MWNYTGPICWSPYGYKSKQENPIGQSQQKINHGAISSPRRRHFHLNTHQPCASIALYDSIDPTLGCGSSMVHHNFVNMSNNHVSPPTGERCDAPTMNNGNPLWWTPVLPPVCSPSYIPLVEGWYRLLGRRRWFVSPTVISLHNLKTSYIANIYQIFTTWHIILICGMYQRQIHIT